MNKVVAQKNSMHNHADNFSPQLSGTPVKSSDNFYEDIVKRLQAVSPEELVTKFSAVLSILRRMSCGKVRTELTLEYLFC